MALQIEETRDPEEYIRFKGEKPAKCSRGNTVENIALLMIFYVNSKFF
jgi:hypothetical protein